MINLVVDHLLSTMLKTAKKRLITSQDSYILSAIYKNVIKVTPYEITETL